MRDFLVVHLQDTECLFFLRESRWQLLSLLSISLIDQHLELQLFLPLFDSFVSVKLGLFHQGVKFEVLSLESVSRSFQSLLDELIRGSQLRHIGFDQPINFVFSEY